jgi:hypothetical protein
MNSHHRNLPRAPQGRLPNWVLFAMAGVAIAAALLARVVVG